MLREEGLRGIEPPLNYVAAHTLHDGVARAVQDGVPPFVSRAKARLKKDEFLGKPMGFIIRIIVSFSEPDTGRFTARLFLKEGQRTVDQVFLRGAFIDGAKELDGQLSFLLGFGAEPLLFKRIKGIGNIGAQCVEQTDLFRVKSIRLVGVKRECADGLALAAQGKRG